MSRTEKGTPHCKLPAVKRLIPEGKVRMTMTALVGVIVSVQQIDTVAA